MTDIERIMSIFGQCYNLLNNNIRYPSTVNVMISSKRDDQLLVNLSSLKRLTSLPLDGMDGMLVHHKVIPHPNQCPSLSTTLGPTNTTPVDAHLDY